MKLWNHSKRKNNKLEHKEKIVWVFFFFNLHKDQMTPGTCVSPSMPKTWFSQLRKEDARKIIHNCGYNYYYSYSE